MAYKIRAILDVENDVIRDIVIDSSTDLESLHSQIAKAFGFNGQEMASFYRSDNDWNQGEEFPLFDMGDAVAMKDCNIIDVLNQIGNKMIYVYDFMAMWTFYIELMDTEVENNDKLPNISFAFGDAPETAPEKEFTADDTSLDFGFEDEEMNGFGDFENIDDYDF